MTLLNHLTINHKIQKLFAYLLEKKLWLSYINSVHIHMCSCYQLVFHARITKYADTANFYTKQAVNILFSKTFFSNSIKLTLQLYTKQMNINIVVVGISLLPVVKMNINIVVVGISLLPVVKMNINIVVVGISLLPAVKMNINIVVVGISLLPVVKMNINIVVVGIFLLPAVRMNGRCALIKTLAIPITGILSLTMYPGHSHKGSRPPTYRTRTLLTLI